MSSKVKYETFRVDPPEVFTKAKFKIRQLPVNVWISDMTDDEQVMLITRLERAVAVRRKPARVRVTK